MRGQEGGSTILMATFGWVDDDELMASYTSPNAPLPSLRTMR